MTLFLLMVFCLAAKSCQDNQHCSECNTAYGDCITECHPGYFGSKCKSVCSKNCKQGKCKLLKSAGTGKCTEGCEPGYHGENSIYSEEHCLERDVNITNVCTPECHNESGECIHGCVAGWYGQMCSSPCNANCINKRCNDTGVCAEGCAAGYFGKESVCYICYRKGRSSTRNNQLDEVIHNAVTEQVVTGEYQALHRYWEIREADMNTESEPSNSQDIGGKMATETYTTIGARYISPIDDDKPYSE
ncbi:multiple epidermal growth factor-like domains protein 11 [Haliotis rufescens]|uniref:multiple epidermal growth factor-like domains protein 11 n=1 Tax=Haliotis rufescens TaxID=6454 RepID=UPI00201E8969|nr:multiple epidermal growth factor-like domains protein 11 [Haliotis rufescens]